MSTLPEIKSLFDLWYNYMPEEPDWQTDDAVDLISNYIMSPYDSKILDLGCGSGRHLRCLEAKGFRKLHGVDFSEIAIKKAYKLNEEKKKIRYYQREFGDFLVDNIETFDLIYSFDCTITLYSESDLILLFEKIYRSMLPGAYCLFEIWNEHYVENEMFNDYERMHELEIGTFHYIRRYDRKSSILVFAHYLELSNGEKVEFPHQIQYVYSTDKFNEIAKMTNLKPNIGLVKDRNTTSYYKCYALFTK
ncbi:MAG: class I SAM-dependent methyltransferase [Sedimentisphaerales bacterium]|nr:class I SAM-dependent methyltransferase [Sedimentisphaerales bacterium]